MKTKTVFSSLKPIEMLLVGVIVFFVCLITFGSPSFPDNPRVGDTHECTFFALLPVETAEYDAHGEIVSYSPKRWLRTVTVHYERKNIRDDFGMADNRKWIETKFIDHQP